MHFCSLVHQGSDISGIQVALGNVWPDPGCECMAQQLLWLNSHATDARAMVWCDGLTKASSMLSSQIWLLQKAL
jgi:hypothetical protein